MYYYYLGKQKEPPPPYSNFAQPTQADNCSRINYFGEDPEFRGATAPPLPGTVVPQQNRHHQRRDNVHAEYGHLQQWPHHF